jgi:hypothetical protein
MKKDGEAFLLSLVSRKKNVTLQKKEWLNADETKSKKFRAIFLSPFSAAFGRLKCLNLNRLQHFSTPESIDKYLLHIIE